jgi:hypothetical protein
VNYHCKTADENVFDFFFQKTFRIYRKFSKNSIPPKYHNTIEKSTISIRKLQYPGVRFYISTVGRFGDRCDNEKDRENIPSVFSCFVAELLWREVICIFVIAWTPFSW